jgi:Armadillo/beta-catenin-like repeat
VVSAGAVDVFVTFLEVLDSDVKEAAIWGLDYIARHNSELSLSVVTSGAL